MSSYEKLLKIKNKCRQDYFAMVITYLFDIGFSAAKEISDGEIKRANGNGMMTKDFVQWMMTTARKIANIADNPIEIVQFCMAEDVYDIRYYANKLPRWRMEEMLQTRISQEEGNTVKEDDLEDLTFLYDCDAEDFELLGFDIPEDMR